MKAWHVAFSRDGTKLASCGRHCEVVVWDVRNVTNKSHEAVLLWQLDGKQLKECPLIDTQYVEFNPNGSLLLVSATAKTFTFAKGELFVCNANDGTFLLHASQLNARFWSAWVDNSWLVVAFSIQDMFSIDLINVNNGRQSVAQNSSRSIRDTSAFAPRINVVNTELSSDGIHIVQHCIISHVSVKIHGHYIFICQVKRGGKKHLASSCFSLDVTSSNDSLAHRNFGKLVPIDGHVSGMALTPLEDQLITAICPGRHHAFGLPPTHVEVRIYDAVGLFLYHRLPSRNMACPLTFFYCHPDATENVIAW